MTTASKNVNIIIASRSRRRAISSSTKITISALRTKTLSSPFPPRNSELKTHNSKKYPSPYTYIRVMKQKNSIVSSPFHEDTMLFLRLAKLRCLILSLRNRGRLRLPIPARYKSASSVRGLLPHTIRWYGRQESVL